MGLIEQNSLIKTIKISNKNCPSKYRKKSSKINVLMFLLIYVLYQYDFLMHLLKRILTQKDHMNKKTWTHPVKQIKLKKINLC